MPLSIGVLTVSDRASEGTIEDRGGPEVESALEPLGVIVSARAVVPDDRMRIAEQLSRWTDEDQLDVILTTGGTGLGPRDVTPEATQDVCQRLIPGIPEALRAAGLAQTPQSILSRGLAGVRGTTLIINLPGSPQGAAEGVRLLLPVLPHAVATMRGARH